MIMNTTTMLLGQVCTLSLYGKTQVVTFVGYDAGDARVQPVGTNETMFVPARSLTKGTQCKVRLEFKTTEFVLSHGREPRGRGAWAFSLKRDAHGDDIFWTPSCTYAEAKKIARAHFQAVAPRDSARVDVWVQP